MRKTQVDLDQGVDDYGRAIGYCHGNGGGYFFAWMPTLAETLASVEADGWDGDGGLNAVQVRDFLLHYLPSTKMASLVWRREYEAWSEAFQEDFDGSFLDWLTQDEMAGAL